MTVVHSVLFKSYKLWGDKKNERALGHRPCDTARSIHLHTAPLLNCTWEGSHWWLIWDLVDKGIFITPFFPFCQAKKTYDTQKNDSAAGTIYSVIFILFRVQNDSLCSFVKGLTLFQNFSLSPILPVTGLLLVAVVVFIVLVASMHWLKIKKCSFLIYFLKRILINAFYLFYTSFKF